MKARRVLWVGVLACLAACRSEPTPRPVTSAAPGASSAPVAAKASASAAIVEEPVASAAPVGDGGRAAPVGGNWLKCYANFQPRTKPDLDVIRLGLMCGPSNGMRKAAEAHEAQIGQEPREHAFEAEAGDCYRVFAVGDPSIEDLDVEIFDPKGTRIAFDTGDDRWPIVKPDGAFCVFEPGQYRARVHAQRGNGRYAMEIWRLR